MLKQLISQIQNRKNLRLQKSFKKEVCRKSIHLSALWIPALIYFSHPGFAIMVFSVLFVGNTILEYGNYKRYRWARKTFGLIFYRLLRKKETRRKKTLLPHRDMCFPMTGADKSEKSAGQSATSCLPKTRCRRRPCGIAPRSPDFPRARLESGAPAANRTQASSANCGSPVRSEPSEQAFAWKASATIALR